VESLVRGNVSGTYLECISTFPDSLPENPQTVGKNASCDW